MNRSLLLLCTAATALNPASVLAEPIVETRIVRIADLDLGSISGRHALDHRIRRAVIDVCGTASDADLTGQNAVRVCRTKTLGSARAQSDQRVASLGNDVITVAKASGR